MRTPLMIAVSLGLMMPAVTPVLAQSGQSRPVLYEYNGKRYNSLADCQRAKKRAKARGAVAGAVIAGAGTALLGGNLGETALVAGGGALVGREIGRRSVKQC
ncbi:hypothetical protein [Sandarakinorhabdus oryzae]|uniref:hypothetical protein n=1 Tax=Sandarakinorhabdus oryzae TaxID=2675220 RepID=UPI0012E1C11A|nr:hypothetical protein [Sandarakinorhabdus oryzae]